jgi:DNA polymerase III epsilon subunit family exonuclease
LAGGIFYISLELKWSLLYNEFVEEISLKQRISEIPIATLDLETTGLDPKAGDEICELAVVFIRHLTVTGEWSSLVKISSPMPPDAEAIHGINDAMLSCAPPLGSVIAQLKVLTNGCVYLIQNAPFDMGFLSQAMACLEEPELSAPILDFLNIARRLLPNLDNYRLATIAECFHLPEENIHRALGDARLTARAFLSLISTLNLQKQTLGELLELSQPIEKPQLPVVEQAMLSGGKVIIEYVDGNGEVTERVIRPLGYTRDNLSLVAYCFLREQERTFKISRIRKLDHYSEEGQ